MNVNTCEYSILGSINLGVVVAQPNAELGTLPLSIVNVGRTLILGLPRKQNGHPIGYITLLMLIFRPTLRLLHLWRFIYWLLPMAKLAELLMSVKTPAKYPTRKWQNHTLFLLLFLTKVLLSYNSVLIVGFTLKITPVNCAYSLATPFRYYM